MPEYELFPLGDQAVTFSLGNTFHARNHHKIMAMLDWVRKHAFDGLLDITVAYNSITIVYDLYTLRTHREIESGFGFVSDLLLQAYRRSGDQQTTSRVVTRIPVCYEGPFSPDMEYIVAEKNLDVDEVITLHTGRVYSVFMIGFLPGFPYMAEVDPLLAVPRKAQPRLRVEAGSVGIANLQTGIYPVASPGGWQIIGRTPLRLFDRDADPPALLEPGDTVQFYSITMAEFRKINEHGA